MEDIMDDLDEPHFLANMGFVITYKCQIACPHCVLEAGPHRKEEMQQADVFSWIQQTAAYDDGRIKTACFTGGEPFYDLEKLQSLFAHAMSCGLVPTVVTNAFWAESREKAVEILKSMPQLRVISISTDQHHLSQIPFTKVENALLAAQDLGLIYSVSICTEDENELGYKSLIEQLEPLVDKDKISTVITFPTGRALKKIDIKQYEMTDEPPVTACPAAGTPTIFPDGRVYACIGPVIELKEGYPLLLGNLKEKPLKEILDEAELNPVLHILRVWGPAKLMAMLAERGFADRLPKRFIKNSICNICHAILSDKVLRDALRDMAGDRELMEKIAYARVHYLHETRMLEMMRAAGMLPEH